MWQRAKGGLAGVQSWTGEPRPGMFRVQWRGPGGQRLSETFSSLQEANHHKASIDRQRAEGTLRSTSPEGFGAYLRRWVTTTTGRRSVAIEPETRAEYARSVRTFLAAAPEIENVRLRSLTPDHIELAVRALLLGGRSPRTVRRIIAPVVGSLNEAVERGLIPANPARPVRIAAARQDPDEARRIESAKALSDDQLRALIEATPPRWRLLVSTAIETGARIGELRALRWGDLDLTGERDPDRLGRPSARIERSMRERRIKTPKSNAGTRTVPIGPGLARDLALARMTTDYPADGDYLFARERDGLPPEASYLTRVLGQTARSAGVDLAGGAWHRLRASAISRWLRAGMSPLLASRLAGHSDTQLVMNTYAQIQGVSERLEAAAFTALAPVEELLPSGPDQGS
jgi:integrase